MKLKFRCFSSERTSDRLSLVELKFEAPSTNIGDNESERLQKQEGARPCTIPWFIEIPSEHLQCKLCLENECICNMFGISRQARSMVKAVQGMELKQDFDDVG